ncbi:MAG: FkbM family methyltransferase [Phycisphaerae bacterium]|jgi:FkbM family methyltransferase
MSWGPKQLAKRVLRSIPRKGEAELARLQNAPRYTPMETTLLGPTLKTPDGPSFRSAYRSIFEHRIYEFASNEPAPLIIDGGANIGLSVIFFRSLYPKCRVIAFEPDPELASYCRGNIDAMSFEGVDVRECALWSSNTTLTFHREGADGGSLSNSALERQGTVSVPTQRLRDVLASAESRVALLKLDIEGAETEVLRDCRDALAHVDRVFVEYHSFADREQTCDEILAILRHAGFRFQAIPENHAPRPFIERPVMGGMDFQMNIFAYR